ncbi:unnamed protein product [Arctogadus glacialis]
MYLLLTVNIPGDRSKAVVNLRTGKEPQVTVFQRDVEQPYQSCLRHHVGINAIDWYQWQLSLTPESSANIWSPGASRHGLMEKNQDHEGHFALLDGDVVCLLSLPPSTVTDDPPGLTDTDTHQSGAAEEG